VRYSVELSRQFLLLFNGKSLLVALLFQTLSRVPSKAVTLDSTTFKVSSSCLPNSAQEANVITAQLVATQTLAEKNT